MPEAARPVPASPVEGAGARPSGAGTAPWDALAGAGLRPVTRSLRAGRFSSEADRPSLAMGGLVARPASWAGDGRRNLPPLAPFMLSVPRRMNLRQLLLLLLVLAALICRCSSPTTAIADGGQSVAT